MQKPSPHRFLLDRDKSKAVDNNATNSTQFKPRPSFNLASNAAIEEQDSPSSTADDEQTQSLHEKQGLGRSARLLASQWQASNAITSHLKPAAQDAEVIASFDSIDDASQIDLQDERHKKPSRNLSPDAEQYKAEVDDEVSPMSKRMRFSKQDQAQDFHADSTAKMPALTQISHKFLTSPPQANIRAAEDAQTTSRRRVFIRPASPPESRADIDPHLLQFSPRKKGKSYEPGGLAATMQSQLMDMTSAGSFSVPGSEPVLWHFTVRNVRACAAFVLVTGSTHEKETIGKFLLAGSKVVPVDGDVVQVRSLTWACELDDCQWLVCVDWKVVKPNSTS